jgi:hypothetical protein
VRCFGRRGTPERQRMSFPETLPDQNRTAEQTRTFEGKTIEEETVEEEPVVEEPVVDETVVD